MNGLMLTIGFFISLITGRYLSRYMVSENKRKIIIQIINPEIRLILTFLLIFAISLVKHWYFPGIVSIFSIIIVNKIKMLRLYSKYMTIPLIMAIFVITIQFFSSQFFSIFDQRTIGTILSESGSYSYEYGFLIFSRVFASASVLIILLFTTSESELLGGLRLLRIPSTIIEISSFMNRYIKTFSLEGDKLRMAQESRLGRSGGFLKKMKRTGYMCFADNPRLFKERRDIHSHAFT